jgi:flavin reductase (DIM6/NTAB) family NADH-FMN oxidoreductase RutF
VLVGAAASFDCWLRQSYRAGDHLIVLGEVVALVHRPQLEPLIFHARTYKSLEASVPAWPGAASARRLQPERPHLPQGVRRTA